MSALREKIVDIKHRSQFLTYLWYFLNKPKYFYQNRKVTKDAQIRATGIAQKKYESIKNLKNSHEGERCFIVATGPSITIKDLELLGKEITFGMNSLCKLFNETQWRPTFYGIQDENVYISMKDDIKKWYGNSGNVFISDTIADVVQVPSCFHQFPLNRAYHDNELQIGKYFTKFSEDCYSIVYDGYSITYSLLQIAAYMGFKKIYLLGTDCNYKKGVPNHVVESGFVDKNEHMAYDRLICGYKSAKDYADLSGIEIVNCTRGGMLEVFPREQLEKILNI